jgi:hypothetical protein
MMAEKRFLDHVRRWVPIAGTEALFMSLMHHELGPLGQPSAHAPATDEIAFLVTDKGHVKDRLIVWPRPLPMIVLEPL